MSLNKDYLAIKKLHKGEKNYLIHDNGGRPFLVYVGKNKVSIYKTDKPEEEPRDSKWKYTKPVVQYKFINIFVGKSPKNKATIFSGGWGPAFTGNSILLQTTKKDYVYIGSEIKKYVIDSPIVKYVSPVGNSDVPYPYGVNKEKKYYLFVEDVIVNKVPKEYKNDPYDYYYKASLITPDIGVNPRKDPLIVFDKITVFYIGSENYTLTYTPEPAKDYKRIVKHFNNKLFIKQNGHKKTLTEKEYVKIMTGFGKEMGFKKLSSKIVVKRIF